nr:MAG TPA: hypothetical protein [Caudoviricetes sp.]
MSVARPQNPATMRAGRLSRHAPQPLKQTYVRCYIKLYFIQYICVKLNRTKYNI